MVLCRDNVNNSKMIIDYYNNILATFFLTILTELKGKVEVQHQVFAALINVMCIGKHNYYSNDVL